MTAMVSTRRGVLDLLAKAGAAVSLAPLLAPLVGGTASASTAGVSLAPADILGVLTADEVEAAYAANPHHPEIAAAYAKLIRGWDNFSGLQWTSREKRPLVLADYQLAITKPLDAHYYGHLGAAVENHAAQKPRQALDVPLRSEELATPIWGGRVAVGHRPQHLRSAGDRTGVVRARIWAAPCTRSRTTTRQGTRRTS